MVQIADNTQQITQHTLHPATLLHHHSHATSYKRHPHLQLKKRRLGKQGNGLRSQYYWVSWLGFKHLLLHHSHPLRQQKGEGRRMGCLGRWSGSYPGGIAPKWQVKGMRVQLGVAALNLTAITAKALKPGEGPQLWSFTPHPTWVHGLYPILIWSKMI